MLSTSQYRLGPDLAEYYYFSFCVTKAHEFNDEQISHSSIIIPFNSKTIKNRGDNFDNFVKHNRKNRSLGLSRDTDSDVGISLRRW